LNQNYFVEEFFSIVLPVPGVISGGDSVSKFFY